jgi:Cytochrome c oxidase caa3 assembly factor (Caa3_CtaG)
VAHGVTLVMTIVELIGDAVLGVVLWLGPPVAAGWYGSLGRDWGPSPYTDQLLGAGVLWVGGDVVGLPFVLLVIGHMLADDEREAVRVDAELDAAELGVAATEDEAPQPTRLWWEEDPQLAPRFRRR